MVHVLAREDGVGSGHETTVTLVAHEELSKKEIV